MKKILWSLGTIVVLLVAAVLLGPGLINWNDFKSDISSQVRQLTGRELSIAGDIRITVLPSPALVANEVAFANAPGGTAPVMAQFKSVVVRVALAPLFRGLVKVETIKLVEPLIVLERLPDGKGNWEIETPAADREVAPATSDTAPAAQTPPATSGLPPITLDDFTIERGTVVYRDPKAGVEETFDGLNARIAAASLSGPFESAGEMTARGFAMSYNVNVGEILHGRTVPLNVRLGLVGGKAELAASGTVLNLDEAPRFKGKVKVEGENLSTLLSALQTGAALPRQLARKFSLEGAVVASAMGIETNKLAIQLGDIRATGDVTIEVGKLIRVASRLGIGKIDLDKWLSAEAPAPAASKGLASAEAANPAAKEIPAPRAKRNEAAGFALPANIAGSMIFSVDAISYRGGVIRDVVLSAELAGGLATISQLSAQFPGGSDLAVFGSIAAVDGAPHFDGEIESTVNDLRGVVAWLGVDIPQVPADRLRKLSLTTKIIAKPSQVQIAGLDLRFDNSRLTGGVTIAVRDRPSFGANIVIDRLNVDSYLPRPAKAGKTEPAAAEKPAKTGEDGAKKSAPARAADPLAGLAVLDTFDANIKAHLKTLVHKGAQIKDVVVDGTLYNGALDIRRFSIAKLAGATLKVKGGLTNLADLPKAKGLTVDINIPDLSRVARLIGASLPMDGKKLGSVSASSRLDGNLLKPKIETTIKVAGATVTATGMVSPLPVGEMIDAKVRARHGDLGSFMRRLGIAYRPSGKVGGFDFTAQITGEPTRLRATELSGKLGKTSVAGAVAIDLTAKKPKLTTDLTTGALIIDPYLPAKRRAGLRPTLQPATWMPAKPERRAGGGIRPVATTSRWPTDPIDLSVLRSFDAEIALKAPLVAFETYLIEKVDFAAQIANGALKTKTFKGVVFGGALDGAIQLTAGPRNQVQTTLKVSGVDVTEALRAVTGEAVADGQMSFDLDVIGSGGSVHDIVGSLGGRGGFDLSDVDAKKAGQGSAMAGLFGLLTSLNSMGGPAKDDKARVTGTFTMARGVAESRDIKLQSAYGNGGATGSVDLPGWLIDMKGEVRLAESFLMQVLKAKVKETRNAVPFEIKGRLDAPNIKVDTGAALGAGVPIPGADILLNKAPKGVGDILRGILGGGAEQQPQASEPPPVGNQPPPVEPQPQQQKKPSLQEQLLKNLLKL